MSMENYGKSGYGFRCSTTDFDKVKAFIEKHLDEKDQKVFTDCENIEEIEDTCVDYGWLGYSDVSTVLAIAIKDKVHSWIEYCYDDGGDNCIMMVGGLPWDNPDPITKEEFEQKAGALAEEFYGHPVKFDYYTTEEWG